MSGKLISRYCQRYRVHCDDLRLLFGTPAQKRALAAGSRSAKTAQAVECEASQSGAESASPKHLSNTPYILGGDNAGGK